MTSNLNRVTFLLSRTTARSISPEKFRIEPRCQLEKSEDKSAIREAYEVQCDAMFWGETSTTQYVAALGCNSNRCLVRSCRGSGGSKGVARKTAAEHSYPEPVRALGKGIRGGMSSAYLCP